MLEELVLLADALAQQLLHLKHVLVVVREIPAGTHVVHVLQHAGEGVEKLGSHFLAALEKSREGKADYGKLLVDVEVKLRGQVAILAKAFFGAEMTHPIREA